MNLTQSNQKRWEDCKLTSIKFNVVAKRLSDPKAKDRYLAVEKKTGVPWWFIAVVHEREASQRWSANIAQGDPWNKRSTHVPVGRGPFKSWEDAAVDALVNCPPHAANNKDWSPGGALTMLEKYNGLGYANKGVPSPYIWSGTDQYKSGKYVADHVYDSNVVDAQLGCAGLLKAMGVFKATSAPKVKPTTGAGTVGTVGIGGAAVAWQLKDHMPEVIIGTLVVALVAYFLVRWFKRIKSKENTNV